MKLPLAALVLFLCSPLTAATRSRRLSRSLSAITKTLSLTTKKPASVAGFLSLRLNHFRLALAFYSRALSSPQLSGAQPHYSNSN